MRVLIKPCLPASKAHACAHGQGEAQLEGCSHQERVSSRRPGPQTQSTDPKQRSSQGVRQSCAEDPEPSSSWWA